MDQLDQKLKEYLQEGLQEVTISPRQQQRWQQAMLQHINGHQLSRWKKFLHSISEFMETTYEISLTPLAAAVAIMVMAAGAAFYGLALPPSTQQQTDRIILLQQNFSNSNQIVYQPIKGERTSNADN